MHAAQCTPFITDQTTTTTAAVVVVNSCSLLLLRRVIKPTQETHQAPFNNPP